MSCEYLGRSGKEEEGDEEEEEYEDEWQWCVVVIIAWRCSDRDLVFVVDATCVYLAFIPDHCYLRCQKIGLNMCREVAIVSFLSVF